MAKVSQVIIVTEDGNVHIVKPTTKIFEEAARLMSEFKAEREIKWASADELL